MLDEPLAGRLPAGLRTRQPGEPRVASVQRVNDDLRRLVVEVHAFVEGVDTAPARALESQIWAEFQESTLRRQVDLQR